MLLPYYLLNGPEAGCDEAGRGCLAGPVCAAAVILPESFSHTQLDDSKKLTHKKRIELRAIIEQESLAYAVAFVDHVEIDKINILKASFLAMHRALDQLSVKPNRLLIDGNRFTPYNGIEHHCFVKGDGRFASIAAASILAKTYRDDYMERLSQEFPHYGWTRNKGYPTADHRKAIAAHGLSPYHRLTFRVNEQLKLF